MSFTHTEKSDDRIRRGYSECEPVSAVALSLGVSRNTVIGRARRLGLTGTYDPAAARRNISRAQKGKPKFGLRDYWAQLAPEEKRRRMLPAWAGLGRKSIYVSTAHKFSEA